MKKQMIAGLMMVAALGMTFVTGVDVYADSNCTEVQESEVIEQDACKECSVHLFGMRPWYDGLQTKDSDERCVIGTPKTDEDGNGLAAFIWTIVLNVLVDMFTLVGLASLLYMIRGGYWYMRAGGDPVLLARGKKTIQTAIIGTGIALLATMVTNFIIMVLQS